MTTDDNKRKDIEAAADHLKASGQKVTLKAVRDALGGGSYSTINPVLQVWREKELAKSPVNAAKELLRYINLDALEGHVRAQAVAACSRQMEEIAAENATTQIRNEELEKQCASARIDLDLAATRLQEAMKGRMEADHRLAAQSAQIAEMKVQEAQLQDEIEVLRQQIQEKAELERKLAVYESRVADQQKEISRLLANADTLRQEWSTQLQHNAALEATVAHLEKQSADQKDTIHHLQTLLGAPR